jgi:DNA replication and repair protein RecF
VHLARLSLLRFRNLAETEINFHQGLNLVIGRNGQGKTNLLEAVHLLALAHSPRARSERDCIAWSSKTFVVRGEGESLSGLPHTQSTEVGEEGVRVKVNGKESRRLSALMGAFALVSFSPEDLELVRGGPQARRRFMDVLLCQLDAEYIETLRRYQAAIKQRNAALRAEHCDDALLDAFEQGIAESGARIIVQRESVLAALKPYAQADYARLANGSEALGLRLTRADRELRRTEIGGEKNEAGGERAADGESQGTSRLETLRDSLAQALRRQRPRDREDGVTSVGPHRDDLMIFLAGKGARDFGSQGQKRSVALSLRMAAAQLLRERLGCPPILLLDDVFAELDAQRQAALGELLRERGQAFIATPRQGEMPFKPDAFFQVEAGRVTGL